MMSQMACGFSTSDPRDHPPYRRYHRNSRTVLCENISVVAQKAAKFMVQTGLLGQFSAVEAAPDEGPI